MAVLKRWTLTAPGGSPLSSHFAEGVLNNVTDTAVLDQLQLPSLVAASPLPYAFVPCSGLNTVRVFRTDTGAEHGSYRSRPTGNFGIPAAPVGGNPSRTSVDAFGNCWIGNRDSGEPGFYLEGLLGSVVKLGIVVGGTRVDADGTPNASGDYLAPPYTYNTIVPHSSNTTGFIRTSRGFSDTRAWTSLDPDDAIDDAIQVFQFAGSPATRFVNVDRDGNVWVAGDRNADGGDIVFEKLDGVTGSLISSFTRTSPDNFGGHGGIITSAGVMWSTDFNNGNVARGVGPFLDIPMTFAHNICEDANGDIWVCSENGAPTIRKFNAAGTEYIGGNFPITIPPGGGRGLACRFQDNSIWYVETNGVAGLVRRYDSSGNLVATITPGAGSGARGCAIDADGKVWFSNFGAQRMERIDPASNTVDLTVPTGTGSYCYADFTATSFFTRVNPSGLWTVHFDAGSTKQFSRVSWTEDKPAQTNIRVRHRFASTQLGLASQPWTVSVNGATFGRIAARHAEVQVFFERDSVAVSATPVLFDLQLEDLEPPQIVVNADCAYQMRITDLHRGALLGSGLAAGMLVQE